MSYQVGDKVRLMYTFNSEKLYAGIVYTLKRNTNEYVNKVLSKGGGYICEVEESKFTINECFFVLEHRAPSHLELLQKALEARL